MSDVGFAGVANFAMTSTATAVRVMGVAGVGGGSEVVAGPSFGLNFITAAVGGPTLDPRITFSRTSNATLIGSDGTLQYAPHNLLTYSEQFDNAAWGTFNATVVANTIAAPNGTQTADKLVENTATDFHGTALYAGSFTPGMVGTISCYLKAAERAAVRLQTDSAAGFGFADFNLSNGAITNITGICSSATATPVGDGWYRCSIVCTATGTSGLGLKIIIGASSYTGNGTSGLYVWGAQLNVGALQPYYQTVASAYYGPRFDYNPTTLAPLGLLIEEQRTNLCLYSNDLNQATWSKGGTVSLSYDTTAAPDGTTTADTITVVTNADTGVYQNIACASSTTYTWSVYVKLGTMAASNYKIAIYDNTNAAFIAVDIVPTQTPSSTAWTRVTYTFTTPATCVSVRVYCFRNNTSASTSVNVWGMQLEQGAFATSYIPTTTTSLTRAADVASVTGANFSSWFNSVEGTLLTTTLALNQTLAPNRYVSTMDDGTTNNIIGAYIDTSLNATSFVVNGGVAVYQEVIATVSNTLPNSIAVTYKANNFMSAANGVLGIPDTSGNVPVVNKITFGNRSDGARPLNGHIRSFKYYPTRLSNAELQALTT